jgi:hypothetical protein
MADIILRWREHPAVRAAAVVPAVVWLVLLRKQIRAAEQAMALLVALELPFIMVVAAAAPVEWVLIM